MTDAAAPQSLFLTAPPGIEDALAAEAREAGFAVTGTEPGGVTVQGGRTEAMRANLVLRSAGAVLMRVAEFRALHLAQLDKRARRVDWAAILRPDVPVRVEAACHRSRIYHDRAARGRIERALAETLGVAIAADAPVRVLLRIEDDLATLSVDTSGEPLHRRGFKEAVGKAPMRETLAAAFLRLAGFDGTEPVVDPMCGSGTFAIEAAEIACALAPGRGRGFAFERLAGHDAAAWQALRDGALSGARATDLRFHGHDRDDGAIRMATANAERAGVGASCTFSCQPISALERPEGPPGLVMVNPPYGARIGDRKLLFGLYATLGGVLSDRFAGWRVGIVTSDTGLAKATGLPFLPPGPWVAHGGLKVRLFRTAPLPAAGGAG